MVSPHIFRQYDIRGVWGRDLTPQAVRAIGQAYAYYLRERTGKEALRVSVGRDVRLSSPEIFRILSETLLECGLDVLDLGVCPTPLQYFSLFSQSLDGGVMITGSHNPPEFNGLKLSLGRETLYGEMIQELRHLLQQGKTVQARRRGSLQSLDIVKEYIEFHARRMKGRPLEGIKAVLDAGNGVAGLVAPKLLRALGAQVLELYCDPDGRFPHHHPDPVVEDNLRDLIGTVRKEQAHVGIGFDGDGDRIGVVNEEGQIVWGDRLLVIFARQVLKEHPGATIIGEVKCSQTLYDDIKAHGGVPLMYKTGHSLIKSKMKETKALLAGEMSGHIFFADRYFGYDDAIYAALRLLEIMAQAGPPYSVKRLLQGLPQMVSTPEIRLDCPDEVKFQVVQKMKEAFKDYPMVDIDGLRVQFQRGWALVRASNTQPALVLRFEAQDEASLGEIRRTVEERLRSLL
jgi:phosphomannomutase/phosphoglucomutase